MSSITHFLCVHPYLSECPPTDLFPLSSCSLRPHAFTSCRVQISNGADPFDSLGQAELTADFDLAHAKALKCTSLGYIGCNTSSCLLSLAGLMLFSLCS
jgi:hypothetical protein